MFSRKFSPTTLAARLNWLSRNGFCPSSPPIRDPGGLRRGRVDRLAADQPLAEPELGIVEAARLEQVLQEVRALAEERIAGLGLPDQPLDPSCSVGLNVRCLGRLMMLPIRLPISWLGRWIKLGSSCGLPGSNRELRLKPMADHPIAI